MRYIKNLTILILFILFTISCKRITGPVYTNNYKIVFTSSNEGAYDLFSIDLNNYQLNQLTYDGKSTSAQSSTVGKFIFYNSNGDIFRMDTDGNNKINLTNSSSLEYEFSISKDGTKIAFVSDRDQTSDELYRTEVYVMDIEGGVPRRISFSKYYSGSPNFSPDNTTIAYEAFDYDSVQFSIHLYSLIDSSDTAITPKGRSEGFPVFSPDGKYLSYYSWDNQRLFLLDLHTKNLKEIIFGKKQKFSSDGKYLYFISSGNGGLDIFRYNIQMDKIENVTNTSGQEKSFDVAPNNKKIVFSMYIHPDSSFSTQVFIKNMDIDTIQQLINDNYNKYDPILIHD